MEDKLYKHVIALMDRGLDLSRLSDDQLQQVADMVVKSYLNMMEQIQGLGLSKMEKFEMVEDLREKLEMLEYVAGKDIEYETADDLLELIDRQKEKSWLNCYYQFLLNCFEFSIDWGE